MKTISVCLILFFIAGGISAGEPRHAHPGTHHHPQPHCQQIASVANNQGQAFIGGSYYLGTMHYYNDNYNYQPATSRGTVWPSYGNSYSSPSYEENRQAPAVAESYDERLYRIVTEKVLLEDCLSTAVISDVDNRIADLQNNPQAYKNGLAVKQYAEKRRREIIAETCKHAEVASCMTAGGIAIFSIKVFE